jgi:uncharacterized protein (TIGR00251 family)
MRIFVRAKPGAKVEKVEKIDDSHFLVAVVQPPIKGKANQAIIKALAEHFGVSPSRVTIVSGHASRQKTIEIE